MTKAIPSKESVQNVEDARMALEGGWLPCVPADAADLQGYCPKCFSLWVECIHPAPHQDGMEQRMFYGRLFARPYRRRASDPR